jgi:hypothetical protein
MRAAAVVVGILILAACVYWTVDYVRRRAG